MHLSLNKLLSSSLIFIIILMAQHTTYGETKLDVKTNITKEEVINWISQSFALDNTNLTYEKIVLDENLTLHTLISNEGVIYYLVSQQNQQTKDVPAIIELGFGSVAPYTDSIIANEEIKELKTKSFKYCSPFESFWNLSYLDEMVYIDGPTGEWIPEVKNIPLPNHSSTYLSFQEPIMEGYLKQDFNSNDLGWLFDNHERITSKEELIPFIRQQDVRLTGAKYGGLVQFSYPVIGYFTNEKLTYVTIYDEYADLTRYVLYEDAIKYGDFYLN